MPRDRKVKGEAPGRGRMPASLIAVLCLAVGAVYLLSNPEPHNFYDYTYRVAGNLLQGRIAFTEQQPSWLNEMVPFEGVWYSVFPLGAVLSMIPAAAFGALGIITEMPGHWIAAIHGAVSCAFLLLIADRYQVSRTRKVVQTLGILFGTFMWTNLTFAGAWQLALGFAMVGELGAIYFTVFNRRPLLAGAFFAMGFGNRTEILLTAPVFFYLLLRPEGRRPEGSEGDGPSWRERLTSREGLTRLAAFCTVPFVLGVATLIYNYVRFHSFSDFGYSRIPGVLEEPWYDEGIFSVSYIFRQAWEMLFKSWESWSTFPYLGPNGFSATIIWSSPFLLFLLRMEAPRRLREWYRKQRSSTWPSLYSVFAYQSSQRDHALKYASWIAIALLTSVLWMHGNSGGWQFGYRYAMVLLPWVFIVLLEMAPRRITLLEGTAYGFAFAANTYATWLYHWTEYMKP